MLVAPAGMAGVRAAAAPTPALASPAGPPAEQCRGQQSRASAAASLHRDGGSSRQPRRASRCAAASASCSGSGGSSDVRPGMPEEDQSIRVKCMLAEASGKLDLSECELASVPPAVAGLPGELMLPGSGLGEAGAGGFTTRATTSQGRYGWRAERGCCLAEGIPLLLPLAPQAPRFPAPLHSSGRWGSCRWQAAARRPCGIPHPPTHPPLPKQTAPGSCCPAPLQAWRSCRLQATG